MNELVVKIENVNGQLVVSSRVVAEQLGKRHSDVIEGLEKILTNGDFRSLIIPNEYKDKKGEMRKEYLLTQDGFTLYMFNIQGYNEYKMAYINEFNKMKEYIKNPYKNLSTQQMMILTLQEQEKIAERVDALEYKIDNEIRVDNGEQRKIQKAVSTRIFQRIDIVPQLLENKKFMFQALYRDLKDRFGVASYRDIKRKDLRNCLEYISTWIEPADFRRVS